MEIVNTVRGADERERAVGLRETSLSLKSQLRAMADQMDATVGCRSELSVKSWESVFRKAQRPSILEGKPWFSVAHVRDCLRFRSYVASLDSFFAVLAFFSRAAQNGDITVVKIDWQKFFRPSPFGWRMMAIDMRLNPSGFLVEYYVSYADMVDINEVLLHKIFENWRNKDPLELTVKELTRRSDDIAISDFTYYSWLFRCLATDEGAVLKNIKNVPRTNTVQNAVQNCRDHTEFQISEALTYFENALNQRIDFL